MGPILEVVTGKLTIRWRLDEDAVVRESDGAEEKVRYADIVEVRIGSAGDNGTCELYTRDGKKHVIHTAVFDEKAKKQINAYNELVRELHRRLAGEKGITFRAGSLFGAIAMPVIALGGAAAMWAMHHPTLAIVCALLSPGGFFRSAHALTHPIGSRRRC